MTFKAITHDAEEGGYWPEVPAVPGCLTQGETLDELHTNLREAVRGCRAVLSVRKESPERVYETVKVGLSVM
jgi:predicted RNase H-like HicB family nuclease